MELKMVLIPLILVVVLIITEKLIKNNNMAQQTSVKTIEEQIDFEMTKLQIDFNNGVQWSMRIIHKSLLRIKRKAEQAKEMHKAEIEDAFDDGNPNGVLVKDGKQYYNETFNK
jgi:hypothetical protein